MPYIKKYPLESDTSWFKFILLTQGMQFDKGDLSNSNLSINLALSTQEGDAQGTMAAG